MLQRAAVRGTEAARRDYLLERWQAVQLPEEAARIERVRISWSEVLRNLGLAAAALERGARLAAHEPLMRAHTFLAALQEVLDTEHADSAHPEEATAVRKLAVDLSAVYQRMLDAILQADSDGDAALVRRVAKMAQGYAEVWDSLAEQRGQIPARRASAAG